MERDDLCFEIENCQFLDSSFKKWMIYHLLGYDDYPEEITKKLDFYIESYFSVCEREKDKYKKNLSNIYSGYELLRPERRFMDVFYYESSRRGCCY